MNKLFTILNNIETIFYLFFILIGIYIFAKCIIQIKSRKYTRKTLEEFKKSPELFLQYLDQYYITNKFYTYFMVFIYFAPTIFMYIFFCYRYIGYSYKINPIEFHNISLIFLINLFLIFCLIVLFKSFFDLLLFKEILKLHLYLQTKTYYINIRHFYRTFYLEDFFGKIYLFFDCISKFKIQAHDSDFDYTEIYFYKSIFENKIILNISKTCVKYSIKYKIINYTFILMNYIMSKIYKNTYFHIFIPYIMLFCVLLYDLLHYEILYTYYIFFVLYFIQKSIKYNEFLEKTDSLLEDSLIHYFYKNNVPYTLQRSLILEKNSYYIKDMKNKSKQNNYIINAINKESLIEYILNIFTKKRTIKEIICIKNIKAMYFRYFIVILLLILTFYFIINMAKYNIILLYFNLKIPLIILLLPIILIIYLSKKVYYLPKNTEEDSFTYYDYNIYNAIIFWIITLFQSFILIFLFYKSNMALNPNEYLFDNFDIEIIKYYTALEKQEYFFYYLYNQIHLKEPLDAVIIYCSIYTEYADIIQLISAETSLKEIQTTVNMLVDYYAEYYPENKLNYNLPNNNIYYHSYIDHDKFRYYFDPFKNIAITLVFHSFMQNYTKFPTLISLKILLFKIIKFFMLFSGNKIIISFLTFP